MSGQGTPDGSERYSENARDDGTSSEAGWRPARDANNRRTDGWADTWVPPSHRPGANRGRNGEHPQEQDPWSVFDSPPRSPSYPAYRRRNDGEPPLDPGDWSAFEIQRTPTHQPERDAFERITESARDDATSSAALWATSERVLPPIHSSWADDALDANRRENNGWSGTLQRTPPHRQRDVPGAPRSEDELPQDPDSWSAFEIRRTPPRPPQRDHFNRLAAEALSSSRARPRKKSKHKEKKEEPLDDVRDGRERRPFPFREPPGFERRSMACDGVHHSGGSGGVVNSSWMEGAFAEGGVRTAVLAGNRGGGVGGVSSPADYVYRGSFADERGALGGVPADLEGRRGSVAGVGFPRGGGGGSTSSNGDWGEGQERPDRKRPAIDKKRVGPLFLKAKPDRPPFSRVQEGLPREEKRDSSPVSEAVRYRREHVANSPRLPGDDNLDEEEKKEEAVPGGGSAGEGGGDGSESDPEEGPECRVCRGGDEGGRRPLIHPCRCRGSIKYVHQDCLMEWIRSRQAGILGGAAGGAGVGAAAAAGGAAAAPVLQAQRCELCRERLNFRARYRPGAPSHLGVSEFLRGAIRRATPRLMNAFRCALNVLMWVVILPILFCTMFRAGIGVALFVTLRVDGIVRGYGIASEYSDRYNYMEVSEEEQILPFVGRVFWSSWMDLFGDWCVGITLMMGFICLGPPCVELAVDFVTVLKTLPVALEEWWTQRPVAVVGPVQARRRNHGIRPRDVGARLRRGILGALDRVENMLMGVLEQLILPPREEDMQGEGLIWGWPAVGTAGGFLGFMGLLMLFAQTLPYTTYLAVHLATSPPERAAPFRYSVLHPVPAKVFSWNSVRRPSAAATAAFSYTSLESKAYGTGLKTLGFSSKWASFEESDGGAYSPWSSEAIGFSGAMAEARLRSKAVRLRAYHPAVATVAVESEEKDAAFKLPFSTFSRVDCKGVRAMIGERMFFIPSPLFSSASEDGDEGGYGASVIPREPLVIMTKRNISESNENDGDAEGFDHASGNLLSAFRGLRAPEKLVTPEEALSREAKNRGQSRLAWWRTTNRSKLSRNIFISTLNDRRRVDRSQTTWWRGPYKLNKRLVARPWVPGRRAVPSAPVYAAISEPFLLDWVGGREIVISADKAYRQRPKWMPKHSSIHEKGGKAESLVMGWWMSTVTFLKGPVIPGTFGLRTGVVFFDTFKGLCMLAIVITLACLIFSIARLYKITNRDQFRRNPNRAVAVADLAGAGAALAANGAAGAGGVGPDRVQDGMVPGRGQEGLPAHVPIFNGAEREFMEREQDQNERDRLEQAERRIANGLAAEGHLGVEIKVMTIGMIELFLIPCWVGVCLDAFSLPLFDSDGDARLAWTEVNPISSMALHWGAGTMASGVVSCLGREIARALHPNLLPGWMKRPADQGLEEMLVRLTQDPLLFQLRGILISVVVYPVVLGFMVFVPMGVYKVLKEIWWPSWMEGIDPVVLGIGEATLGDRLGMDLVLFHFILPVLMEHLKIRAPVRRVTCWVLTTFCGVTGSKELLLHPALVAGRGGRGNDPDDLDDVQVPPREDNGDDIREEDESYVGFLWDHVKVALALVSVSFIFLLLPAVAVLLPLFTGRAMFEISGLPLDDDLPPTVAGAIVCSFVIWVVSALLRIQLTPGHRRRVVWDILVLSGKWLVVGLLLLVVLPSLTGLLVHDALRGPLPPAEETAVLTWGKMWALGLVCVKLWARCVMAGAIGNEAWQGRLRRVRVNGIRGIDFKYTLHEVCIPLLDCVAQYYFWPYLVNRFVLPMVVVSQRDLKLLQKGMPFLFIVLKVVLAGVMFGVRKIKALHDQIRDDEYLVGVELENMPHDDSY